jgi:outer membrane protein OmpA-like peptidoglycan-associated protein
MLRNVVIFFCLVSYLPVSGQIMLEKLTNGINTDLYEESSPVISHDGKSLYFTRSAYPDFCRVLMDNGNDLSESLGNQDYQSRLADVYSQIAGKPVSDPINSPFNQDVWIAEISEDGFTNIEHPAYPLNNALPNSVVSTSLEDNKLIVINQFYSDGSMYEGFSYTSRDANGIFNMPEPIHIYEFYNLSSDINMSLSLDGKVMVLSLKRKDSYGQNDLYVSFLVKDDLWSAPKHMGSVLNTIYRETTPFLSRDKKKLYFSSNRRGTLGGNDIYMSERIDYTWLKWTEPKPLKEPINSPFDDSQPFIDHVNDYFYFTSKRDGSSDIFRLALKPKPRLKKPIVLKGKIRNSVTGKLIRSQLYYGPRTAKGYLEFFNTYSGEFEFTLTEYDVYKFLPSKIGFESKQILFDARLADEANLPYYEITLYLDPVAKNQFEVSVTAESGTVSDSVKTPGIESLAVGELINLSNIYFIRSEATILDRSTESLNNLVSMMRENPDLVIRIEGHTDNVGIEKDLMDLSWRRTEVIKQYLINHEIARDRIKTVGYGPNRPVTDNSSEEKRSQNRRVELRILKD